MDYIFCTVIVVLFVLAFALMIWEAKSIDDDFYD